jgi:hypothetical protein
MATHRHLQVDDLAVLHDRDTRLLGVRRVDDDHLVTRTFVGGRSVEIEFVGLVDARRTWRGPSGATRSARSHVAADDELGVRRKLEQLRQVLVCLAGDQLDANGAARVLGAALGPALPITAAALTIALTVALAVSLATSTATGPPLALAAAAATARTAAAPARLAARSVRSLARGRRVGIDRKSRRQLGREGGAVGSSGVTAGFATTTTVTATSAFETGTTVRAAGTIAIARAPAAAATAAASPSRFVAAVRRARAGLRARGSPVLSRRLLQRDTARDIAVGTGTLGAGIGAAAIGTAAIGTAAIGTAGVGSAAIAAAPPAAASAAAPATSAPGAGVAVGSAGSVHLSVPAGFRSSGTHGRRGRPTRVASGAREGLFTHPSCLFVSTRANLGGAGVSRAGGARAARPSACSRRRTDPAMAARMGAASSRIS